MAATRKKKAARKPAAPGRAPGKPVERNTAQPPKRNAAARWSGKVTRQSDALDLEPSVFRSRSSAAIARSLKRSAEASRRRKGTPFQSAMSMLNFYINRGGTNLSAARKRVLQRAKQELRKVFHRDP